MNTPFQPSEYDCNAKELVRCLHIVHDLGMWDVFVRDMAAERPLEFIKMVNEDRDTLIQIWEEERRNGGQAVIVHDIGTNKIGYIKVIRELFGWGLQAAKTACETVPHVLPVRILGVGKSYMTLMHVMDRLSPGMKWELIPWDSGRCCDRNPKIKNMVPDWTKPAAFGDLNTDKDESHFARVLRSAMARLSG